MRKNILLLISRTLLFLFFQLLIFAYFFFNNDLDPLFSSAKYWPVIAVLGSFSSLLFLNRLLSKGKISFKELLGFKKEYLKKDLLTYLWIFPITVVLAMVPNVLLSNLLLGGQERSLDLLVQPLPVLMVYVLLLLLPLSIAISELPIYFGYLLPRLRKRFGEYKAMFLTVFFLSLQHSFLPLLLDWKFFLWRFLMYLPFALFLAFVMKYRPRLLPYLMVGHFIMDFMTAFMYLLLERVY